MDTGGIIALIFGVIIALLLPVVIWLGYRRCQRSRKGFRLGDSKHGPSAVRLEDGAAHALHEPEAPQNLPHIDLDPSSKLSSELSGSGDPNRQLRDPTGEPNDSLPRSCIAVFTPRAEKNVFDYDENNYRVRVFVNYPLEVLEATDQHPNSSSSPSNPDKTQQPYTSIEGLRIPIDGILSNKDTDPKTLEMIKLASVPTQSMPTQFMPECEQHPDNQDPPSGTIPSLVAEVRKRKGLGSKTSTTANLARVEGGGL
ncbi:hypothetical protein EDB80DRAFT_825876 [Ilyonectria destructans]|nr:hypothetical protein EDB80DRAFT_825876 [Ilyonectria destructans]